MQYYSGVVVIPKLVTYNEREFSVTSIGGGAFEGCKLNSVSIPNSVTNIQAYAFISKRNTIFCDHTTFMR